MKPHDPSFVSYAAGLFDGEGCVGIYGNGNGRHVLNLALTITNTHRGVLDMLVERWGGRVSLMNKGRKATHQDTYRWRCGSRTCLPFLAEVRPYLVIKAEQADLATEFGVYLQQCFRYRMSQHRGRQGAPKLPEYDGEIRRKYAETMKNLKQPTLRIAS